MPSCDCILSGQLLGCRDGLNPIRPGVLRCEVRMRVNSTSRSFLAVRDFPPSVRVSK